VERQVPGHDPRLLARPAATLPEFASRLTGSCDLYDQNAAASSKAGHPGVPGQLRDIAWFTPAGQEMTEADWQISSAKSPTVFLKGDAISEPDRCGEPIRNDSFLLLFNASDLDLEFTVPPSRRAVIEGPRHGGAAAPQPRTSPWSNRASIGVASRSVQVLCRN
jgi:pullulanase/glycogen debranching enzyme